MDKQKVGIYFIVGIMIFSVVGLAGALLIGDNSQSQTPQEVIDELQQQQQEQLSAEEQERIAAENCQPIVNPTAVSKEVPEAYLPPEDVTELAITDIKEGSGEVVEAGDCVEVFYHGTLASDGAVFDSSYERGEPVRFPLTGVIQGWQEGLVGMKEGGVRRLVIPSELAYGEAGSPPLIGPNADLVFVVELIKVQS